jgi:cardiolipin synthase
MVTLPNLITLIRIVLIPIFVSVLLYYRETGNEHFRWLAIVIFAVAVLSDAIDGFIARVKKEKTLLGSFLDPLADKLLIITAVIVLSIQIGNLPKLPIWFPVLVISRDSIIVIGALLIHILAGKVTPQPSVSGKVTTFFQMLTIVWVLVDVPLYIIPLGAAAIFTFISGFEYILMGMKQLQGTT